MATIADNITSMAALVAKVKREYRLTETTVLRIVDMNFAIAQSNPNAGGFGGDETIPMPDDEQLEMFPEGDEAIAKALKIVPTGEED